GLRVERLALEREERAAPLDGLGEARKLVQIERAQPLHERDHLPRQRLLSARNLAAQDLELAPRVGIADPLIDAAPLDRIVDLARAVGSDDDHGSPRRRD